MPAKLLVVAVFGISLAAPASGLLIACALAPFGRLIAIACGVPDWPMSDAIASAFIGGWLLRRLPDRGGPTAVAPVIVWLLSALVAASLFGVVWQTGAWDRTAVLGAARFLEGSILVTLGVQEPQLVSKTLVDFVKGRENMELRGMILDGRILEGSFVRELARLPGRKELLTQVAIRMKSPITGFVLTLKGLVQSLVIALSEIQKKKTAETPQPA